MTNETRKVRKNYNLKSHPLHCLLSTTRLELQLGLCSGFVTSRDQLRHSSQNNIYRLFTWPHQAELRTTQGFATPEKGLPAMPVEYSANNG